MEKQSIETKVYANKKQAENAAKLVNGTVWQSPKSMKFHVRLKKGE